MLEAMKRDTWRGVIFIHWQGPRHRPLFADSGFQFSYLLLQHTSWSWHNPQINSSHNSQILYQGH